MHKKRYPLLVRAAEFLDRCRKLENEATALQLSLTHSYCSDLRKPKGALANLNSWYRKLTTTLDSTLEDAFKRTCHGRSVWTIFERNEHNKSVSDWFIGRIEYPFDWPGKETVYLVPYGANKGTVVVQSGCIMEIPHPQAGRNGDIFTLFGGERYIVEPIPAINIPGSFDGGGQIIMNPARIKAPCPFTRDHSTAQEVLKRVSEVLADVGETLSFYSFGG